MLLVQAPYGPRVVSRELAPCFGPGTDGAEDQAGHKASVTAELKTWVAVLIAVWFKACIFIMVSSLCHTLLLISLP